MNTFTEKLLTDLIHIPSETKSEQKILVFLLNFLKTLNLKIQTIPVENNRYCILATSGKPKVLLVSHIDTVVGQLPVSIDQNFIYGRGSCDNKASVATMITAAKEAIDKNLTDFGLLFTVGEESNLIGAQVSADYFKKHKVEPKLVVIGEPTKLKFITAQKGILLLDLQFSGKANHSSQTPINSAIHKLISTTNLLLKLENKNNIVNIGKVEGGLAANISADKASATFSIRSSDKKIKEKIEKILTQCDCKFSVQMNFEAKNNSNSDFPLNEVNWFSEMYFFASSVIYGAGDIRFAHSQEERVPRIELKKATKTYLSLIEKYSKF